VTSLIIKRNMELNKIKQELLTVIDGLDIDNAYSVVKEKAILFSLFCAKNYNPYRVINQEVVWKDFGNGTYTTEELYKKWSDEI
jgi:hypothetical protein